MPSAQVLPPHIDAARRGLGRAPREPNVPAHWPGTYVPNFSEWRPGDIVLVEATGLMGVLIRAGQLITANPMLIAGSRWSHAAIYVGNGDVVDATLGDGIQLQSVWNYCQQRAITLRRVDEPSISPTLVAKCATLHIGEPYSVMQAILAKLGWPASQFPNPDALYCSTFVSLVVAEATGIELTADPKWHPPYPGAFAMHSDLIPVPLDWRNI